MSNLEYIQRDLAAVWHPCTQMKDHETLPMIPIRRGEGVFLEDFEGKRYIDAISSWWVNLFGHANPRINAALRAQLDSLEHVMLAGFTHAPVIELSERLVKLAPQGLTRCFYADNGASAIEIALKMSFHYWRNCGQPKKTKFLTLENSYHGETLGALAVGNVALFKDTYAPLLMETLTAPSPAGTDRESGESLETYAYRKFQALEVMLAAHADELAAVIVEPLVQGAAGMRMYPAVYLQWLRAACDKYQVHLIADEIAVGFGRTGTMFACEQAGIRPDLLCLSKGITGGYLPLSVVMSTEQIYQAFYADYARLTAFLHSHSYTGNALACRAAVATLDIFESDKVIENNKVLAEAMRTSTAHLQAHPHVLEVRQQGMILAIELTKNKATREPYPWQERRGLRMYQYALQHGALLRPMGGVLYFMPPYMITPEQIQQLATIATGAIDAATQD